MYTLSTTRFINSTWESNINYRNKHNISGCIYGSPLEMSPKILYDSLVFIVEMNNEERVRLVSNMLVVLCSDTQVSPTLSTNA